MPRHRLERHLRAELRRPGQLEEAVALAERAVLGKRPAGLPHEPDRRPLDRLAPAGADEERLRHGRRLAPVPGPLVARWRSWSLDLAARRSADDGAGRGRERRRGDLGRRHRRLVPLARRARQRDRLGRDAHAAPGPVAPGERVRLEIAVRAPMPPGALRLRARPRRRAPRLVRRARGRTTRRARPSRSCRESTATALRDVATVHAPSTDGRLGEPRAGAPRRGLRRRRGCDRRPAPPPQAARAVGARPRPRPRLRAAAALPVRAARLELERLPDVEGLPAFRPPADEPWVYDASLVLELPRARRRCGRRRA